MCDPPRSTISLILFYFLSISGICNSTFQPLSVCGPYSLTSTGCVVPLEEIEPFPAIRWLRMGWQSVISQEKIPGNTVTARNGTRVTERTDREIHSFSP